MAISDEGAVVYAKGFGLANLETNEAWTPETVMDIASVSKQFTGAALLLLVQDGKVSLDDDIHQHVPELADYGQSLRLRDLLWMESGLPDYANTDLMTRAGHAIDEPATAADILEAIATIPTLDFVPGTQYAYSNTAYFLLRLVVERVSGQSFAAFTGARIFEPLGMRSTSTWDESAGPMVGAALRYVHGPDFKFRSQTLPWDNQGAAGVYTTVLDLLRWADNFRSGVVGGRAFLQAQLEPGTQTVPLMPSSGRYAAGLILSTYREKPLIWHLGGQPGLGAALILDRGAERAVALMCNSNTVGNLFFLAFNAMEAWFGPGA